MPAAASRIPRVYFVNSSERFDLEKDEKKLSNELDFFASFGPGYVSALIKKKHRAAFYSW